MRSNKQQHQVPPSRTKVFPNSFPWPFGMMHPLDSPRSRWDEDTSWIGSPSPGVFQNVKSTWKKSLHGKKKNYILCYPKFSGSKSAFGHLKVALNFQMIVTKFHGNEMKKSNIIWEHFGTSCQCCSVEIIHPQWCWRPGHWVVRPFFRLLV